MQPLSRYKATKLKNVLFVGEFSISDGATAIEGFRTIGYINILQPWLRFTKLY
jgi:hypothetical protein